MKQKIKGIIEYCNDNIWGVLIAIGIVVAIGIIIFNFPLFVIGLLIGGLVARYFDDIMSWCFDGLLADYDNEDEDMVQCAGCKKFFSEYDVIPILPKHGKKKYYCPDCCVSSLSWCNKCGEAFEAKDKHLCPDCEKELEAKKKNAES